mgnify:CR=1 FL=1
MTQSDMNLNQIAVGAGPRAMRRRRSCWSTRNRAVAASLSGLDPVFAVVASKRSDLTGKAARGAQAGRIGAAEERRSEVGARTRALRELTHRVCSNATSAASEVSYAVRPKGEYRSAPAQRASHPQPRTGRPQALLAHNPAHQRIDATKPRIRISV